MLSFFLLSMNTVDQTAKAKCRASTTFFLWLYWLDTPPVQSDQLCFIGADMTSATSLSLSTYNLLLYVVLSTVCRMADQIGLCLVYVHVRSFTQFKLNVALHM